jgi:hypothetical protein
MQPYLFPYIGYFQLISSVDLFVIADDLQWINGGWINRNRILTHGQPQYLTLPVHRGSRRVPINRRELCLSVDQEKQKLMRRIESAYHKAPYFEPVFELLSTCFACPETNVAAFTSNALAECCRYLDIGTPFVFSSKLDKPNGLKAEDLVLAINQLLDSDHYINPIGGTKLYCRDHFTRHGMKLSFLKPREIRYHQFSDTFIPSLSIIDVLMFNSAEQTAEMLNQFDLV